MMEQGKGMGFIARMVRRRNCDDETAAVDPRRFFASIVVMLTVYAYQGCSTCRTAQKWLEQHHVPHQLKAIRETPPSVPELKAMLKARGELRPLFNTSGLDYRALGIKDKLPTMSEDEALKLLASNGNLIKRPFAIDSKTGVYLTGFKADEWSAALGV